MCSSVLSSSLFLPSNNRFRFHSRNVSVPNYSLINHRSRNPSSSISASVTDRSVHVSWFSPDLSSIDGYGGWATVEAPTHQKKKKAFPPILLVGIGTSIAAVLAVISYFSLSRRGLRFQFISPLNVLHEILMSSGANKANEVASSGNTLVSEANPESVSDVVIETVALETKQTERREGKLTCITHPVSVDSTQQEALLLLKKLKIIEDDVKAEELCSRREYARWIVRVYSLLERNPKHRIKPSVSLSGSIISAFDDVSIEDPDFQSVQCLAEVGIILSKLSSKNSGSNLDDSNSQAGVNFFPESFVSRQDLISWKAQLEYDTMPGINEKISRTNIGFMDMRDVSLDAPTELFMDMLADNKSIIRKVFGQIKRLQPNKPSTKAQAAVALTSGMIAEAIRSELSRLEAEESSSQNAMREIRFELLERGDIKRYWDGKLEEEKSRGFEVDKGFFAAIHDLEEEKKVQENTLAEHLKEKAAMDCQKQLLSSLKEEVQEMSERLASEGAMYTDEQCNLRDMLSDLQVKQEGLLDAKSILEAEIEALRILRSWIENEARKSQARAKVLEEVGRRWKWDDRS